MPPPSGQAPGMYRRTSWIKDIRCRCRSIQTVGVDLAARHFCTTAQAAWSRALWITIQNLAYHLEGSIESHPTFSRSIISQLFSDGIHYLYRSAIQAIQVSQLAPSAHCPSEPGNYVPLCPYFKAPVTLQSLALLYPSRWAYRWTQQHIGAKRHRRRRTKHVSKHIIPVHTHMASKASARIQSCQCTMSFPHFVIQLTTSAKSGCLIVERLRFLYE